MNIRRISIYSAAIAALALLVASSARVSLAQDHKGGKNRPTESQMLDLQKQFEDASIAADAGKVSALMSDDAIFVHASGAVQTKAEYIASLTGGQLKLSTYAMTDGKVVFFRRGAVVSGPTEISLVASGGAPARTLRLLISTVWVERPSG